MGFEKFGKTGYVSQTKIRPMLSYLERGQVPGTRCTRCNRLYFPPRADCLDCRTTKVEWVPLDGNCQLITFTKVHFPPPAFQEEAPYVLGVAELENSLRVFAPISSQIDPKDLKPGLHLILKTVQRSGDGVFYQLETPSRKQLAKKSRKSATKLA